MAALTPLERMLLVVVTVSSALAGVANYGRWAAVPRFALATVALAGLAWVVSFATEQLGECFGPGVTGVLQSTLGNLPELFVVIFALQKGGRVVAPAGRATGRGWGSSSRWRYWWRRARPRRSSRTGSWRRLPRRSPSWGSRRRSPVW